MTIKTTHLIGAAPLALVAAAATAAPVGTQAGNDVVNSVTVDFRVGNVPQTQKSATDSFKVDRKLDLVVVEKNGAATQVAPGSSDQVIAWTVTNNSNDRIDFALTMTEQATGATTAFSGPDRFNVTSYKIYRDTNGNGTYDAGTDAEVGFLDEIASGDSVDVFVVSAIPAGVANGDAAGFSLEAAIRQGGTAGSLGAAYADNTLAANTPDVQNVFVTGGGTANAGRKSALDNYVVAAPLLTVFKTSRIVSDPVNNTTSPKAIPGAVVEYCISVNNASGGAQATNISVADTLPPSVTFIANSLKTPVTVTSPGATQTCASSATGTGTAGQTSFTQALPNLNGGASNGVIFQATIK